MNNKQLEYKADLLLGLKKKPIKGLTKKQKSREIKNARSLFIEERKRIDFFKNI